jgi:hypothetical protein
MKKLLMPVINLSLLILVFSCEPISVSVNSQGEIAFTRSEGVFIVDLKNIKLTELHWNFGKESIPVIAKWSPKEDALAFTIRENKDSQNTSLFYTTRKGENKKSIYNSPGKPITQVEWSAKGTYVTIAQAGEDTDLSVADIVLVSVKDGMSKVIIKNCGDIHKWIDDNSIIFIKVNKKNPNNGDILQGDLSLYKIDTQETIPLTKVIVGKVGGLDANPASNQVIFTAIKTEKEATEFSENMSSDTFAYIYNIKEKILTKISDGKINFVNFSPDGNKILAKVKDEENAGILNLVSIDLKTKAVKTLVKNINDSVNVNSTNIQIYPAWLDNGNVIYFRLNNNYGANGQALHLMTIDANSLKKTDNQLLIDTEVTKLIDKKGGY